MRCGKEQGRSDVAAEGGVVRPGRDEAGRAWRPRLNLVLVLWMPPGSISGVAQISVHGL